MSSYISACPYYLSSNAQPAADIVFLPYNYLIESVSRISQKVEIENAIIIFDEGHNMESSCTEAYSFDLTVRDLVGIAEELDHVIGVLKEFEEFKSSVGIEVEAVQKFKERIVKLTGEVKAIGLSKIDRDCTRNGDYIYTLFGMAGFTKETLVENDIFLEKCKKLLGKKRIAINPNF
jgi:regulator of telomere elongation helicase 1